ncbi:STAS domain-containing protein [Magnetospirillum sp. UT-4]|uniref:STAS domain-containing protein n=1 Tax=Magnetospirillum sp. UT-4 TaxID=2681467 RepID=UPI00137FABD8|nr:STAS domain-containing protein [Magnetospirillum sp. UT-4]CAA7613913.1 Anti-sigma factor antagonist [Magnetospirillum sp. UT-4]
MHKDKDRRGAAARIELAGRLTFAEHADFRQMMARLDSHPDTEIVVDLSRVEHVDSAGLGLLLVAREKVMKKGGRVVLRNPGGQVGRMLALARFRDFFDIETDAQV